MTYQPKSSANLYPGGLDASGISGYKQLIKPPLTAATEVDLTEDVINTDGEVLMQAFVSPALGIDEIAAGDWVFRVFGYVDTVDGDSEIVIRVYLRDAAGSETELFDTTTGALTATAALYMVAETETAFATSALTDRLVVKFFAKTSSAGTRTIHLFYLGEARQTRLSMPSEIAIVPGGDMQAIMYDADLDGQVSGSGGSTTLAGLTDVTITGSQSSGDALVWDGSTWIPGVVSGSGSSDGSSILEIQIFS